MLVCATFLFKKLLTVQLIRNGDLTIGALMAFYAYLALLYQPFIDMAMTLNDMNGSLVGMERYTEYDNEINQENHQDGLEYTAIQKSIEFKNVNFAYNNNLILNNINLQIGSKDKILIEGKSGIGKSTIASILNRFHDDYGGLICFDDVDIKEINIKSLRKNIFYLLQGNSFYVTTIRENFKRVRDNITDEHIWQALEKAQIADTIRGTDCNGLDTLLVKNAVNFSGGQRRRLSLALLFATESDFVILDEPFTGLDNDTRQKIWLELKNFCLDKTMIMIDHNFIEKDFFSCVANFNNTGNLTVSKQIKSF